MNFLQYSDNRYQELIVRQGREKFSRLVDGEQRALQFLLAVYRNFWAAIFIPKAIFCFALVNLGLLSRPLPQLEMAQTQMDTRKGKLKKKLGFNTEKIEMPENPNESH